MSQAGYVRLRRGLLSHLPTMADAEAKFFMYALMRAKNAGKNAGQFRATYRDIADDLGWGTTKVFRIVARLRRYISVDKAANQHGASTFHVLNFGSPAVPPEEQHRNSTGTAAPPKENSRRQKENSTGTADAKKRTAPAVIDSKQEASEPLKGVERVIKGVERELRGDAHARELPPEFDPEPGLRKFETQAKRLAADRWQLHPAESAWLEIVTTPEREAEVFAGLDRWRTSAQWSDGVFHRWDRWLRDLRFLETPRQAGASTDGHSRAFTESERRRRETHAALAEAYRRETGHDPEGDGALRRALPGLRGVDQP